MVVACSLLYIVIYLLLFLLLMLFLLLLLLFPMRVCFVFSLAFMVLSSLPIISPRKRERESWLELYEMSSAAYIC